jgi:N-acetylglucosamine kinase-like BadF-type ATPase
VGEKEMIDPMTALAGIQSAISMVKKASKVANDLGSLAPMIGKMFDAKNIATKALIETKKGKGSNMGAALQIEMALEQARVFEEELKMLFMTTGKIDVWNKIKSRQDQMDRDDARELSALQRAEKKAKEKEQEMQELAIIIGGTFFVLFLVFIGINELMDFCNTTRRCGGR